MGESNLVASYTYADRMRVAVDAEVKAALNQHYRGIFPDIAVLRVRDLTDSRQQRLGRDVALDLRKPRGEVGTWTIEEKIRTPERSVYPDLCAEYLSNREQGTLGWAFTSQADWLSYVRQIGTELDVLILPMQPFRIWFGARWRKYTDLPGETRTELRSGQSYQTCSKAVPFRDQGFQAFLRAHGHYWTRIEKDGLPW